ncbi:hypothetical protein [Hymenobacter actinosclerus]|uniref:Uncharacterized protein n=1 Tax=Hymenobacter actinosclerus TaxID=82805 RepID=A0A1I0J9N4_9BACT|nr:hypothetical protein [Hymenobacter actinosclerus]SEU05940.1 hypothetical protein SAMN04487998_3694 [Hymenobacter actinosclerus]
MFTLLTILPLLLYFLGILFLALGGWQLLKLLAKLNVYVQLLIDKEQHNEQL